MEKRNATRGRGDSLTRIHELRCRAALVDARRVIVKIGTRVLVRTDGRPDTNRLRVLVTQVARLRREGFEVLLVTSGAIGAGMQALGLRARPQSVPELQMCAAVGQTRLMSHYGVWFARENLTVGQVLLTHGDFTHTVRMANARRTLSHLLRAGVIPIINENDVVADEEIRADLDWGDNDYLAALLAKLMRADVLVLLTTVDGLRAPGVNGRTSRVRILESITRRALEHVTGETSALSKGGMGSKLKSAQLAARSGCSVVIANGRANTILPEILSGADVGTLVLPSTT